ncbi:hypothetical protein KI387_013129, partial [Taxus chinensis]
MEAASGSGLREKGLQAMGMQRSASRPQLDVTGAAIQGNFEDRNPIILLPNQSDDISHFAIDIGGSLIKIVYFSRHADAEVEDTTKAESRDKRSPMIATRRRYPILGGRLHFVRFETSKLNDCLSFIQSKNLHCGQNFHERAISESRDGDPIIKATGGGAYKFADIFKDRLGVTLGKEDEMDCLVAGANFLLKIGLSASTIASSFGKVVSENKDLADYRREDIALSLLRMISYNIGQIAYLNALRYGLKRIFFGGFFIRGHAYTMDTISFAVHFWSKGSAQAMFLRHEGFLGALGAFMSYDKHGLSDWTANQFVERFPMGAPYAGGKIHGPPIRDLNEKISWMEKFVQKGIEITAPVPTASPRTTGLGGFERPSSREGLLRSDASAALNVGVLHLVPSLEPFPLLADPKRYEPNTVDLGDPSELQYWFTILSEHLPDLVDKAVASEGGTDNAKRRGDAFARAFRAHLARLMEEPAAYGKLGLANLLELREECLREFHFSDAYRAIKQRENEASLAVLQDLLMELDSMDEDKRLLALIEGVLAANIFDWGSRACVELYHKGTIIEIYRMSRKKMRRPWRVDDFDKFKKRMLGSGKDRPKSHKRALLFVDNSGADVVLGMLPLTRELLRRGTEVVLIANSLPALNDVTASELPDIVAEAAKHCDILRKAAEAGGLLVDAVANDQEEVSQNVSFVPPLMVVENGCGSPCIDFRQVSSELAAIAKDADL